MVDYGGEKEDSKESRCFRWESGRLKMPGYDALNDLPAAVEAISPVAAGRDLLSLWVEEMRAVGKDSKSLLQTWGKQSLVGG